MHTTAIAVIAALASTAISASIPGLPACAGNCVSNFGSCGSLDVKCICSDTSLLSNLACCVSVNCDTADQDTTIKFADALCAGQGVTNLPSAATCAAGETASSFATGSTSATGSLTSTPASLSSALVSASASASSATMTMTSSNSMAPTSAGTSDSSAGSAASTSNAAASATTASASASATAASEGGVNGVERMGLGLVVAGLLAAL